MVKTSTSLAWHIFPVFASLAAAVPSPLHHSTSRYDYIVVGGGTSGLVVANRLSEDPSVSVAIIEAGDFVFDNKNVTDVSAYGKAFGTQIDWEYKSEPQKHALNESQTLRAGKALGGTSTFNGMTYLRAEDSQLDAWAKLGNNITWDSLLPYYERSEYFQVPTAAQTQLGASYESAYHGYVGPLAVGWPDEMVGGNFSNTLNATFASMNLPWNGEPNAGHMRGYNIFPKTVDRIQNVREDAGRAFYLPISDRPNLDLYRNAFAQKLTWESESHTSKPFANGVTFMSTNGTETTLSATREVILSAGSLRSPLLLELSGVGNKKILEKNGINVTVNNPFVGENLQDQTTTDTSYNATTEFEGAGGFIGYFNVEDVYGNKTSNLSASIKQSIPEYARKIAQSSGNVLSAQTLERLFSIQHDIIFKEKAVILEVIVNAPSSGNSLLEYWGLMPFSRGNIHIQSANASAPAAINPNYFMLEWDMMQQVGTAKMARAVANTSPFKDLLTGETLPGLVAVPANASDNEWAAWLKTTYRSNFHYVSTAAMMSEDLGGVVDSDHLVYGTANVRVVDASVLPFQVSGHLTSTLYALAERAAERIKSYHQS
ncbi:GMC oxidoreductase [Hortaea werneckii]|nr:GMC oxidoreductase [Hortaea werneckii]